MSLLFVHGWATDNRIWTSHIQEVANNRKFYNINLPGHGGKNRWEESTFQSPIREILSHLSCSVTDGNANEGLIGIGWSLGAQILLASVIETNIKFKGLILIGATPCFVKKKEFPWGQPKAVVKKIIINMKKDPLETIKRFYKLNFTEDELKKKDVLRFINRYEQLNPNFKFDDITTGLEALYKTDLRDYLSRIETPTLIIHGKEDQVCPVGAAYYLSSMIKGSQLNIFEKAGHAPFLTETKEFNKIIQIFINKL